MKKLFPFRADDRSSEKIWLIAREKTFPNVSWSYVSLEVLSPTHAVFKVCVLNHNQMHEVAGEHHWHCEKGDLQLAIDERLMELAWIERGERLRAAEVAAVRSIKNELKKLFSEELK